MGAVAWGLVVLGLTFVILLLGAIVLPAQANEIPAEVPNTVSDPGATRPDVMSRSRIKRAES